MAEYHLAIFLEMLAIANGSEAARDQLAQHLLAFDQRQGPQIMTVHVEEIEGVIDDAVILAGRQRGLESGEIRSPARPFDHQLTIEDRILEPKRRQSFRNAFAKFFGPIEPAPREKLDPPVPNMRLQAIAIELDLVEPFGAFRRGLPERRQRRLDEPGPAGGLGLFRQFWQAFAAACRLAGLFGLDPAGVR